MHLTAARPFTAFSHRKKLPPRIFTLAVLMLLISACSLATGASMDEMDHGPFVTWTIRGEDGAVTYRGIVIRVSDEPKAAICFDTDLLRVSAAWTGGFLQWFPERDGLERNPTPQGVTHFSNAAAPGWSIDGTFSDPRRMPYGPIPAQFGRYDGLYRHGKQVVLAYTLSGCRIRELPGFELVGGEPIFTRTFDLTASDSPLTLRVCQIAGRDPQVSMAKVEGDADILRVASEAKTRFVGFTGLSQGAKWSVQENHLCLQLPSSKSPSRFQLLISDEPRSYVKTWLTQFKKRIETNTSLPASTDFCEGGPPQWLPVLETAIAPGPDRDALAVDALPAPEQNPWHSWIRFGGLDFLSPDQAILGSVSGDVWLVSGLRQLTGKLRWKRFATGLYQPLGVKIIDGQIYVLGRDQITRLRDLNNDGEADHYENFNSGWMVAENFHSFVLNLETDSKGNFFFAQGAPWPPEVKTPHQGVLFELSKDGRNLEVYADGLRGPNGLAVGPGDLIVYTDNEGHWLPTCSLQWARRGGFHGMKPTSHLHPQTPTDFEKPICWIPHDVDNSAGDPVWIPHGKWGPFQDKLLLTSYGKANLSLVLTENAGGILQGGVMALPFRFQSGLIRARFNPYDDRLYVCGLSVWQTAGVKPGGFYRVRYTGKPAHVPTQLHARRDGLELTFSEPLDPNSATDPANYHLEQWNYRWVETYGSPHYSVKDPDRRGHDQVLVRAVQLSADHRTVHLRTEPLQPVMQMRIEFNIVAADGAVLHQNIYNTIHALP